MNKRQKMLLKLGVLLVFGISIAEAVSRDSTIVFENNQLKNVVIAIHESVAEDKSLIDTLKTTMTKASQYLFTATKQRAYFREITILLPSTWSSDPSYGVPTNESLQFADVVITDPPKSKRSLPQTRSYSGCGKQGVHVLLTKEFLTDESVDPYTNNSAKYFIHAFAQFRWGVFQEYAESGESQFYFSIKEGRADAIKCTLGLRGLFIRTNTSVFTICYPQTSIDPNTNLYLPTCEWKPYPSRQRTTASIMDHQYIEQITNFCDDSNDPRTGHNFEAPSKHNRLCGHRSTWDIISNTPDFSNNNNPPITSGIGQSQLAPTFTVMRSRSRRRRAIIAVEKPFMNDRISSEVESHINRYLHEHTDEHADTVLTDYNGDGDQLLRGLNDKGIQPEDSRVILITKNQQHIANRLKNLGAGIVVIGVGDSVSDMPGYHGSHHPGTTVYDHLSSAFNEMALEQHQYVMILREDSYSDSEKTHLEGSFYLDPALSVDLVINFHITREDENRTAVTMFPNIWLETPSGEIVEMNSENCVTNKSLGVVRFRFGTAEDGIWKYTVDPKMINYRFSVIVKAKQQPFIDESPIVLRQRIQTNLEDRNIALFCDVTRGNQPVVGLNVTATIAKHDGHASTIQLWDNGAGADISKDDGVYSRFITKLEKGTYHVTFKIIGEPGSVWSKEETLDINPLNTPVGRISRRMTKRQVEGALQRHVYGGSFQLKNNLHSVEDRIPPSRISDLRVERIMRYRNTIVLTWTAPGDDLDTGKVSRYELLIGRNIKDVREILTFAKTGVPHEGIAIESVPARKTAGETETFLWDMGDISTARSFAFAIMAVDRSENVATVSNVATTGFGSD